MNPEVIRELQSQLAELNNIMAALGGAMANMGAAAKETSLAQSTAANDRNKNTQSITNTAANTSALKNAQEATDKVIKEASANFKRAVDQGKTAVMQFSAAVFSSEEGMAKYGKAADSLGSSAFNIGKNFGLLGMVLGGAAAIFGKVVGEVFKLDDNIINFRDGFTKASGVLPVTTSQLGNLAKQARFSLDDMQKLSKTTSSLGTSLTSLGSYAGDGAVKFMKMAAVSDDVRRQYGRMGVSQEELLDSQAKYIQLQGVSGQSLNNQRKSTKQLQQESLAYADNLTRMSSLTGKSKDELQAARETAMLEYEEQLKIAEENQRIKELRASGRGQEADAIEKEQKNRQQLIQTYTDLYGAEQGQLAGRVMRQGGYDEKTAIFKQRGEDMLGFTEKLKTSNNAMGDIAKQAEKTDQAIVDAAGKFNQAAQFGGDQLGNKIIGSKESLIAINKRSGMKITDALAKINKDMDTKKQAGADPLADSIEDMRSFERESKAKLQSFFERIDPLRNGLEMLKNAAYAVAAVIGLAVVGKTVSGAVKLFKGPGAAATGAAGETALGAGAGSVGASGGALPKLRNSADSTKLEKDDGTFSGIVDALKQAGKSSMEIIKGAGSLAIAVVELSAGIAGATWLMGKALPTFAAGLKSFNDVKGKNLIDVGLGMAGLGAGVLAMASGKVLEAGGNIIKFFTGGKDPLTEAAEMLTKLQNVKLDRAKIENNGAALMAFAKAMAAIAAIGAVKSISGAITGVFNGIAGFFGQSKFPWSDMEEFGKKNFDTKKITTNSNALAAFGNAMMSYKGSSAKQTSAAIADATTNFFKTTPPYVQMVIFSMLYIDHKKVKNNSKAFKVFAEAMSSYKGYGNADSAAASAIAESVTGFFKATPPFDQMVKFGELNVNSKAVKRNAIAFTYFADAMAAFKGFGSPVGAIGTALADATSKFFKIRPPLEQVVYFSHLNIDQKKTRINAKSFVLFSEAMASYKGGQGLLSAVSTIAAAKLNSLFGQDSAVDAFYNFSKKDFGPKAALNAKAFLDFSTAMGMLSNATGSSGGMMNALGTAGGAAIGTIGGGLAALGSAAWSGIKAVGNYIAGSAGDFIAKFEGFKPNAYVFPGEKLYTIGFGHVIQPSEIKAGRLPNGVPIVGPGGRDTKVTKEQASSLLNQDLPKYTQPAAAAVGPGWSNMNDRQKAAFASYSYNAGPGGVRKFVTSNNIPQLAQQKNWGAISTAFRDRGVRTGSGRVLPGLVNRRAAEGQMILQARKGGLFSGPSTGYPMELHGTEMVIPQMSPNSLLTKLANTNSEIANLGEMMEAVKNAASGSAPTKNTFSKTDAHGVTFLNPQMIAALSNKFDSVIDILSESDDLQGKILKHSMV